MRNINHLMAIIRFKPINRVLQPISNEYVYIEYLPYYAYSFNKPLFIGIPQGNRNFANKCYNPLVVK